MIRHGLGMAILASVLAVALNVAVCQAESVIYTKHNLSASGPGTIRAVSEERVCIFCHTPHHAVPSSVATPLWSRPLGASYYDIYASSSLKARPGQPTGSSRLCLSCHDGTIALGMLYGASTPIQFVGGVTTMPPNSPANLTTDLSDDHPISFAYTTDLALENGELRDPATLPPAIKLEKGVYLQCTSCHNPHNDQWGNFLVMRNYWAELCTTCHDKRGWNNAIHSRVMGRRGCNHCHTPHNAEGPERLLKKMPEEEVCFQCHPPIERIFVKPYNHPLDETVGVHDPTEDPLTAERHVECFDCHNPHQAQKTRGGRGGASASPPDITQNLVGVKGVNLSGVVVAEAEYQYEICFKCHADNSFAPPTVPRQILEDNIRLKLDPANPSYHPIAAPGRSNYVPSLRPYYNTGDMIYCTDCHNNDGSTRLACPIGSIYPHILREQYIQDDYASYTYSNYALCFNCHDPNILFSSRSTFPPHDSHVRQYSIPCSACHDPHGVPQARGATEAANAHLINFDTRFATGTYDSIAKSCNVTCHASNPKNY